MKTLRASLALHRAYHQHPLTRATHAVAVPLMVFGAMIPLSWMGAMAAGAPVTIAMLLTAGCSLAYIQWDARIGSALAVVLTLMLYAAHRVSQLPVLDGALLTAASLALGATLERFAHARFEGRVPPRSETLGEFFLGPPALAMDLLMITGLGVHASAALAVSKQTAR